VDVTGLDVHLGPVVHDNVQNSADRVADVTVFTTRRACDWADVLRPAPARIKDAEANDRLVELDDLHPAGREFVDLIGIVESLALKAWHRR
jgi:hypothetical protein